MSEALDAILEANDRARAELLEVVAALPAERQLEGWFGPAEWSVRDVLAHIARWEEAWSVALGQIARGERPVIPEFEPNRDDPDAADAAYNAESVARARNLSWEQLLVQLRTAREQHAEAVRGLEALDPDRYAEGRTAHRLSDAAEHDREHLEAILEWRREQGV